MNLETLARNIGVEFGLFSKMLNDGLPTKQLNDVMAVLCVSYKDLIEPNNIGSGFRPNPNSFIKVPIISENLFFGDIPPVKVFNFKTNDYLLVDTEAKPNMIAIHIETSRLLFLKDTPRPRFAIITPGYSKSGNNFFVSQSEKIFFTDCTADTITSDYAHIGTMNSIQFGTKEEIEDRAEMLSAFFKD